MAQLDYNKWRQIAVRQINDAENLPEERLPARINIYSKEGEKQSTRLLKACCPECGYTIRVTNKWAALGLPVCPTDLVEFTLAEKEEN